MIDHLLTALQNRLEVYDAISSFFGFLSKIPLVETYPEDLSTSLPEEIVTSMSPLTNLSVMFG